MRGQVAFRVAVACVLALSGAGGAHRAPAQTNAPVVYVIAIEGMIDLGLAPFLSRTIREAQAAGAAAVLLDINTFGGRVDAAVAMRDALLNAPVRTIAFVNQRAISAGALIALACDTLIMTKGGTIGAAASTRAKNIAPAIPASSIERLATRLASSKSPAPRARETSAVVPAATSENINDANQPT